MAEQNTPSNAATDLPSRRSFYQKLSISLGALCAAVVGIPSALYLFMPIFKRVPQVWRPVGPLKGFTVGKTVLVTFDDPAPLPWSGVSARTAAWLRRETEDQFIAFAVNCTHLGCPVRWLQDADLFLCPCHGGVYYGNGAVAAGPPPRALFRYETRIRNGAVEILTTALPIAGSR